MDLGIWQMAQQAKGNSGSAIEVDQFLSVKSAPSEFLDKLFFL